MQIVLVYFNNFGTVFTSEMCAGA